MQLNAPVSANDTVVVPLPPVDFRIAAASLTAMGKSLAPIVSNADLYVTYPGSTDAGKYRREVESAISADTLGTAIGQARRAVELLNNSSEVGADAISSALQADVVMPLQKTIDYVATVGGTWNSESLRILATNLRPVLNGSSTWSEMLTMQPKVVVGSPSGG